MQGTDKNDTDQLTTEHGKVEDYKVAVTDAWLDLAQRAPADPAL